MLNWSRLFLIAVCFTSSIAIADETRKVDFDRDVRPILSGHCAYCHGPDEAKREAKLRLDTRAGLFAESESKRPIVSPNSPEQSELFQRVIAAEESERMPPKDGGKPLSALQIETLRRWIEQGAEWKGHWAFEPIQRPAISNDDSTWSSSPVDALLVRGWKAAGVTPAPDADSATLIRRLSFDLTGLPAISLDADEESSSVDFPSNIVERLLASPHFGERLAVYWLDLVRYADSCGYHSDVDQNITPYRDYVISAFNRNLPFDQFTREQLAGDLLPNATLEQQIATGFNRLNKSTEEGGAQEEEYLAKAFADRVRTVSGTWLALTFGCAECHDHKFDPVSTRDFYQFGAFFADVKEKGVYPNGRHEPEIMLPTASQRQRLDDLTLAMTQVRAQLEEARTAKSEQLGEFEAKAKEAEQQFRTFEKSITRTMITVSVAPREIRILPRGDWLNRNGEVVTASIPRVFNLAGAGDSKPTRLDLVNWLVDRRNPLTARVFVNRLWKLFFGTGLSKNLDDLGAQGEAPSQPELLDWLAAEFIDSGWDIKHLVRLIVESRAYRLSSVPSRQLLEQDPHNRLFARQSRWRLDAEFIRDNALSVAGLINNRIGGPSVKPYQPEGYWEFLNFPKRTWVASTGSDQYRRGLYTHWQRTFLHPAMLAFDASSREECAANRPSSNTPKAALALLNDPSQIEASLALARRIIEEGGSTDRMRLAWAWKTAMSRAADDSELNMLSKLLVANRQRYQSSPADAELLLKLAKSATSNNSNATDLAIWASVARAIMNLHEFTTRN